MAKSYSFMPWYSGKLASNPDLLHLEQGSILSVGNARSLAQIYNKVSFRGPGEDFQQGCEAQALFLTFSDLGFLILVVDHTTRRAEL